MKYIFDFDDVIFKTTLRRKEYIYPLLENIGITNSDLEDYYQNKRSGNFSLKELLAYFSLDGKLYEEIMQNSIEYANKDLIEIIKNLGKENCFIVTYGSEEFQLDKIRKIEVDSFFSEIIVTSGESKNKAIERICEKFRDETVYFIDDKIKHFEDLDMEKCSNLKTILFDNNGLEKLYKVVYSN